MSILSIHCNRRRGTVSMPIYHIIWNSIDAKSFIFSKKQQIAWHIPFKVRNWRRLTCTHASLIPSSVASDSRTFTPGYMFHRKAVSSFCSCRMLNAVLLRRYPCPSCLGLGVVLPKFPDAALLPLTMGAWVTFSGSALNGPKQSINQIKNNIKT